MCKLFLQDVLFPNTLSEEFIKLILYKTQWISTQINTYNYEPACVS